MRLFLTPLLLIPLCCQGEVVTWNVPRGLEDGLYGLAFSDTDTEGQAPVFEPLGNFELEPLTELDTIDSEIVELDMADPDIADLNIVESTSPSNHSIIARGKKGKDKKGKDKKGKLPVSRKGCVKNSPPLDPADHYATKQALYNWCDRNFKIAAFQAMVGVNNTVVYWICNIQKFKYNRCSSKELIAAEKIFNETCGEDKGAWIAMKTRAKTVGRAALSGGIKCYRKGPP